MPVEETGEGDGVLRGVEVFKMMNVLFGGMRAVPTWCQAYQDASSTLGIVGLRRSCSTPPSAPIHCSP